jgi:hypothetical protein
MKVAVITLGFLCASTLAFARSANYEVINDDGFRTDDYSKMVVADVSGKDFLKSIEDRKNYDAVADQLQDMNGNVRGRLEQFCQDEFNSGKGGKILQVTMDVKDFNPGSTAAAVWVGFGAGSGHCTYEVHFWDHNKDVAGFTVKATILRLRDATGESGRNHVPSILISAIRAFLQAH